MRRKDREIIDEQKIEEIIKQCTCCHVGFNDDGEVYIVPLNFGYEKKDDKYIFYFHSAKRGRKIELIQKNPNVGFEMDTNYVLQEADLACDFSALYQSIIGNGIIEVVESNEEKIHGLSLIMKHNTGKEDWTFPEKMLPAVAVLKMDVTKMSCKAHQL